mmetsp:Transcript_5496/g.7214  ORF Transcript_5496/g.7214 Transcript_5496/m.7214 type:complete len:105 (+) Transcript_5496:230-544(+)
MVRDHEFCTVSPCKTRTTPAFPNLLDSTDDTPYASALVATKMIDIRGIKMDIRSMDTDVRTLDLHAICQCCTYCTLLCGCLGCVIVVDDAKGVFVALSCCSFDD